MRLAAALLLVTSVAGAESSDAEPNLSFAWSAPALCPAKAEVLARAARLIGHPVAGATLATPVELVASVEPLSDATWQLEVLSGARGESKRVVTASSCDELGDAMALLIALSIDPDYAMRATSPEGNAAPGDVATASSAERAASLPPAAAPVAPARVVVSDEHPNIRAREPLHLGVAALGAVALGRLPGVAPGGALRVALVREPLVFALELGLFPARRAVNGAVSADLSLAALGGSLGYALFNDLLTPYAGLELGVIHGVGRVDQPESHDVWLLAADAGLRLSYPVQRSVNVLAGGQISILAEQARFYVQPNTDLFRPARLGSQFGLGAEWRLR